MIVGSRTECVDGQRHSYGMFDRTVEHYLFICSGCGDVKVVAQADAIVKESE